MKVYIAAAELERTQKVAEALIKSGATIVSTWHKTPFQRTDVFTELERSDIAERCANEIRMCDRLLLLDSPDKVPGGKFVEFGIALGLKKGVVISGRRENMLCWHPGVWMAKDDTEIVDVISESGGNC
jgi:nucleoside 2-deoxyribosyltransferase